MAPKKKASKKNAGKGTGKGPVKQGVPPDPNPTQLPHDDFADDTTYGRLRVGNWNLRSLRLKYFKAKNEAAIERGNDKIERSRGLFLKVQETMEKLQEVKDEIERERQVEGPEDNEKSIKKVSKKQGKKVVRKRAKTEKEDPRLEKAKADVKNAIEAYDIKDLPHQNRRYAEINYEDFLYWQNHAARWLRTEKLHKTVDADIKAGLNDKREARLMDDLGDRISEAGKLINGLTRQGVGLVASRIGQAGETTHDKFHWTTPVPKRDPVGLGTSQNSQVLDPLVLIRDDLEIERRRLQVENVVVKPSEGQEVGYASHHARRLEEVENFDKACKENPFLRNGLRNTRTATGLYISAAERNDDWPTSYDCLDTVQANCIALIPHSSRENSESPENHLFEFEKPSQYRERQDQVRLPGFTEATDGRREYHVYRRLRPASPVNSPPHSPVHIINGYAQDIYDDTEGEALSEELNAPNGDGDAEALPRDSRSEDEDESDDRVIDHYGVLNESWPRLGLLVPYQPSDVTELPEQEKVSKNAGHKYAGDNNIGKKKARRRNATNQPEDLDLIESDSDDPNDLFRRTYLECSGLICNAPPDPKPPANPSLLDHLLDVGLGGNHANVPSNQAQSSASNPAPSSSKYRGPSNSKKPAHSSTKLSKAGEKRPRPNDTDEEDEHQRQKKLKHAPRA